MANSHSRPTFLTWLLYVNIFHFATFGFNLPFSNLLQQKQFTFHRIITIHFLCLTPNESISHYSFFFFEKKNALFLLSTSNKKPTFSKLVVVYKLFSFSYSLLHLPVSNLLQIEALVFTRPYNHYSFYLSNV